MSSVRYFMKRLGTIPRALATPAGVLAAAGAVGLVLALFTDGWIAAACVVVSVGLWLLAFLVLVDRQKVLSARPSAPTQVISEVVVETEVDPAVAAAALSRRRIASARQVLSGTDWSAISLPDATPTENPILGDPLVTVVVSCFNDARFIIACLSSVMEQTYPNLECIVVDDASLDDSVRTAFELAETDERFRVVRHTRNSGLSAVRNTGLRLAGGELITFLDADDLLMPESIADRVDQYRQSSFDGSVAGTYCGVVLAPEDAELVDYQVAAPYSAKVVDFTRSGDRCPFNVHAALVRTEVARAAGGFNESMRLGAEDWDLWYRILRNGFCFEPSKLSSAVYRQKQGSMRLRNATEHFGEAQTLTAAAYRGVAPGVLTASGPHPFTRSKADYEMSVSLARRAVQAAARALIGGSQSTAQEILETAPPVHPSVLNWDVGVDGAIIDGFRSYLGLSQVEFRKVAASLTALTALAQALVNDGMPVDLESRTSSQSRYDVLLVPMTSAQLDLMASLAEGTALTVGVVDCSASAGDQGVADYIDSRTDLPWSTISHNQAVLHWVTSDCIVIGSPADRAIGELVEILVARGASAVAVSTDLDDMLSIPDAHTPAAVPTLVSEDGLRQFFQTGSLSTLVESGRASEGRGVSDPVEVDAADAWMIEEYPTKLFDGTDLERFKDIHQGERVVIIGNGPSLNELDLSLLKGTATFGVNGIFYADDRLPEPLTYYVVEDTMVVRDNLDEIREYRAGHRFFPSIYREMIGEGPDSTFFMMNRGFYATTSPGFCVPRFSTNIAQRVYAGQSVTIMNLQLAYYMGFTEVILIGMDFSYTVPESSEVDGAHITSRGDDPNHFHPEYFGKGKVWKDPKLDRVLANYAMAKQVYEADGRRIVNATPGGNLHLFERVAFEDVLTP